MNKPFLSLSMAVLCSLTAMAQNPKQAHTANMPKSVKSNPLTANKTTATDSRLVATSYYSFDNGLAINDSSHAYYNSNLGYDFAVDEWKFQNSKSWDGQGQESYRISNTFDSKNHIATTMYEYFDGANWGVEEMTWYTFTPDGQHVTTSKDAYYNGMSWDSSRYTNTYNTQGNILTGLTENYDQNTSTWRNQFRVTNTYNSNGLLDVSLTETYNSTTSQWEYGYRKTHTYNSNKQLTSALSEGYMSGNWSTSNQENFTYDVNGNVSMELQKHWNGIALVDDRRITNTYNGSDKTSATSEIYMGSSWVNWNKEEFAYNKYHQSTMENSKSWDAASSSFIFELNDYELHNYYEDFPNSVKDAEVAKGSMSVYPVPAANELTLKTNFATAQNATVTMFDMSGRMVKQLSLPTATQHSQRVDVSSLPAGHYTVQVTGNGANMMQHVNIVK